MNVTLSLPEILSIFAILISPIVAIQIQKLLSRSSEYKNRQLDIFNTLLATRSTTISDAHIEALNKIDTAFYGFRFLFFWKQTRREKAILDAWNRYRKHLSGIFEDGSRLEAKQAGASEEELKQLDSAWQAKGRELFINMLHEMSQHMNYKFSKEELTTQIYYPQGRITIEQLQLNALQGWSRIVSNEQPIMVQLTLPDLDKINEKHIEYATNTFMKQMIRVGEVLEKNLLKPRRRKKLTQNRQRK